jgi:metal-responsive CopG/Arc/MetJ family transcriptional regulator
MKEKVSPSTDSQPATLMLPLPLLAAVDSWRRQHGNPSRASYIRKAIAAELRRDGLLQENQAA